jgi:hypothetical protein
VDATRRFRVQWDSSRFAEEMRADLKVVGESWRREWDTKHTKCSQLKLAATTKRLATELELFFPRREPSTGFDLGWVKRRGSPLLFSLALRASLSFLLGISSLRDGLQSTSTKVDRSSEIAPIPKAMKAFLSLFLLFCEQLYTFALASLSDDGTSEHEASSDFSGRLGEASNRATTQASFVSFFLCVLLRAMF